MHRNLATPEAICPSMDGIWMPYGSHGRQMDGQSNVGWASVMIERVWERSWISFPKRRSYEACPPNGDLAISATGMLKQLLRIEWSFLEFKYFLNKVCKISANGSQRVVAVYIPDSGSAVFGATSQWVSMRMILQNLREQRAQHVKLHALVWFSSHNWYFKKDWLPKRLNMPKYLNLYYFFLNT